VNTTQLWRRISCAPLEPNNETSNWQREGKRAEHGFAERAWPVRDLPELRPQTAIDVDAWPYHVPMTSFGPRTVLQPVRQPWRYSDTELDRAAGQAAGDLTPVTERRLSAEQRRALAMLATAGSNGLTQQLLVVCSSNAAIVAALVDERLATMTRGSVQVGGKMMEVATVRITDSGRDALVSED